MYRFAVIIMVAVMALLSGCASTRHAKDVQPSGFLTEYRSLLQPGKEGEEALLVYRNPRAPWARYTKILLVVCLTGWSELRQAEGLVVDGHMGILRIVV